MEDTGDSPTISTPSDRKRSGLEVIRALKSKLSESESRLLRVSQNQSELERELGESRERERGLMERMRGMQGNELDRGERGERRREEGESMERMRGSGLDEGESGERERESMERMRGMQGIELDRGESGERRREEGESMERMRGSGLDRGESGEGEFMERTRGSGLDEGESRRRVEESGDGESMRGSGLKKGEIGERRREERRNGEGREIGEEEGRAVDRDRAEEGERARGESADGREKGEEGDGRAWRIDSGSEMMGGARERGKGGESGASQEERRVGGRRRTVSNEGSTSEEREGREGRKHGVGEAGIIKGDGDMSECEDGSKREMDARGVRLNFDEDGRSSGMMGENRTGPKRGEKRSMAKRTEEASSTLPPDDYARLQSLTVENLELSEKLKAWEAVQSVRALEMTRMQDLKEENEKLVGVLQAAGNAKANTARVEELLEENRDLAEKLHSKNDDDFERPRMEELMAENTRLAIELKEFTAEEAANSSDNAARIEKLLAQNRSLEEQLQRDDEAQKARLEELARENSQLAKKLESSSLPISSSSESTLRIQALMLENQQLAETLSAQNAQTTAETQAQMQLLRERIKTLQSYGAATAIQAKLFEKNNRNIATSWNRWIRFAERQEAAVEVERMGDLARKSFEESELLRAKVEELNKEKLNQMETQKKLKTLLVKAKLQIQAKSNDTPPEGFTINDVLRKTRGPDGAAFYLIKLPNKPSTPQAYEWKEESIVCTWLVTLQGSDKSLLEKPTMEDELQDRYQRANRELESVLQDKQLELDALQDRFDQFKRRAELALEKAETMHKTKGGLDDDVRDEMDLLKSELTKVARERDDLTLRLEEIRQRLDLSESSVAGIRLREKTTREERDELIRQCLESSRTLELAKTAWEMARVKTELDFNSQTRVELEERRAVETKLDEIEKKLEASLHCENELKEVYQVSMDKVSTTEDKVEGLRAALARSEAKFHNLESTTKFTSAVSSPTPSQQQQQHQWQQQQQRGYAGSASIPMERSASTSPRISNLRNATRPHLDFDGLDDSASVMAAGALAMSPYQHARRDSLDGGSSVVNESQLQPMEGSKFFVDQIGAMRATQRQERLEWQRERAAIHVQMEDSNRRKDQAEVHAQELESQIVQFNLNDQRQRQLAESTRTVSETPDGLLYLKNVVFRFITADDDSERETLLPVITTLLKFTPEESSMLADEVKSKDGSSAVASGLFGLFSSPFKKR